MDELVHLWLPMSVVMLAVCFFLFKRAYKSKTISSARKNVWKIGDFNLPAPDDSRWVARLDCDTFSHCHCRCTLGSVECVLKRPPDGTGWVCVGNMPIGDTWSSADRSYLSRQENAYVMAVYQECLERQPELFDVHDPRKKKIIELLSTVKPN